MKLLNMVQKKKYKRVMNESMHAKALVANSNSEIECAENWARFILDQEYSISSNATKKKVCMQN